MDSDKILYDHSAKTKNESDIMRYFMLSALIKHWPLKLATNLHVFIYIACVTVPTSAGPILMWPLGIGAHRLSTVLAKSVFSIYTCDFGFSVGRYFGVDKRTSVLPIFASDTCSAPIFISEIAL